MSAQLSQFFEQPFVLGYRKAEDSFGLYVFCAFPNVVHTELFSHG